MRLTERPYPRGIWRHIGHLATGVSYIIDWPPISNTRTATTRPVHPMPAHLLNADEIVHRLQAVNQVVDHEEPLTGLAGRPREAAVLLPLFRQDDQWRLLFIRRSVCEQDRHSGEVAFPGGRVEDTDPHSTGAALRECREEIGLHPQRVQLLGDLPAFRTSSNYMVTPVVGHIPWPVELQPDPREVARVFSIPLRWLADPDNHEIRPWHPPGHPAPRQVIFFREYDDERLWGVSARITVSLLTALGVG